MPGGWDDTIQNELFPELIEDPRPPVPIRVREVLPPAPRLPAPPARPTPGIPFALPDALRTAAGALAPARHVEIVYTRNRSIILSLGRGATPGEPDVLRAHECFRSASPAVAEAAVRLYLCRCTRAERRRLGGIVTQWHHDAAPLPPSPDPVALRSGRHHDLRVILDRVNRAWFEGRLDLDISFGDRPARRLMGRHERRTPRSLVLINPTLDHPWITSWYLEFLVFHEGLHEIMPPVRDGSRLLLHPPGFRAREIEHPDHARAHRYERWIMGAAWRTLLAAAQETISQSSPPARARARIAAARRPEAGGDEAGGGEP